MSDMARQCPKCGLPATKILKCPECKSILISSTNECPSCGYYFKAIFKRIIEEKKLSESSQAEYNKVNESFVNEYNKDEVNNSKNDNLYYLPGMTWFNVQRYFIV